MALNILPAELDLLKAHPASTCELTEAVPISNS